jgi:tetratricopeptide (TPR) repeat protein
VTVSLAMAGARLLPRDQWDLWALLQRWHKRRQYRAQVAGGWNPYATVPPSVSGGASKGGFLLSGKRHNDDEEETDPRRRQVMELRAQVSEAMAHRNLASAAELYLQLRATDPTQVLSRNAQLDIANQLAELSRYADAAEAYELFLRTYPNSEQHAHVELLTGLLYSRYLEDPVRARAKLEHALPRLTAAKEIELARSELARLPAGVRL